MSNNNESNDLKSNKLTPNELRKYPGLEDVSEEETNEIIEALYQLSLVAYTIYHNNSKN
jgi:hypothetical protein